MSWPGKGRQGGQVAAREGAFTALAVLFLVALCSHPMLASDSPSTSAQQPLISLLVPWDAEAPPAGALENLGEAPYLASPADERRLQAFLESGRLEEGGALRGEGEWETPRSPDLFLLTEVQGAASRGGRSAAAASSTRRRTTLDDPQESGRRKRDGGGFMTSGGSRIRTGGVGGGFAGSAGMRVGGGGGFGGMGGGRGLSGAGSRMSEGPSLSIVNPLDVLRQRLLLEIARRRMRESEDQIQANRELLKSIGKREAAPAGPGDDGTNDQQTRTPSSM